MARLVGHAGIGCGLPADLQPAGLDRRGESQALASCCSGRASYSGFTAGRFKAGRSRACCCLSCGLSCSSTVHELVAARPAPLLWLVLQYHGLTHSWRPSSGTTSCVVLYHSNPTAAECWNTRVCLLFVVVERQVPVQLSDNRAFPPVSPLPPLPALLRTCIIPSLCI